MAMVKVARCCGSVWEHTSITKPKAMRTRIIIPLSFAIAAAGLTSCSQEEANPASAIEKKVDNAILDLRADKEKAAKDLTELRQKVDAKLEKLEAKLNDTSLSQAERDRCNSERLELNHQRERIDKALDAVGSASESTWEEVKRTADQVADDVSDWFKRQEEKVDRATDSDHDQDGH